MYKLVFQRNYEVLGLDKKEQTIQELSMMEKVERSLFSTDHAIQARAT